MQRLKVASISGHDGVWSEPDPDGEFVSADEAIEFIKGAIRLLEAAKDALPSDDAVYLRIQKFLSVEANANL